MRSNYLQFVEAKNARNKSLKLLNEAFTKADIYKVVTLLDKVLAQRIPGLIPVVGFVDVKSDGEDCKSKQYLVKTGSGKDASWRMFSINWLISGESAEIFSIDFFNNSDMFWKGTSYAAITLHTVGASIALLVPLIAKIITGKELSISREDIVKIEKSTGVKESAIQIGSVKYILLEGLSKQVIKDAFMLERSEAEDAMMKKRDEVTKAISMRADQSLIDRLTKEYEEICAAVQDGAKTEQQVKISIARRKLVKEDPITNLDKTTREAEDSLEKTKKDPEQVFKEMRKYIDLVVKGLQSSVIICGAPGVGKTYRVSQQLKEAGYVEDKNLCTFKGKGTPRTLYLSLYNFKDKGDIILIDDADALVGPNAPEDSINILKGALDSTSDERGRLVTYGISTKLVNDDGQSVPKKFYYNGSVIIITNYNVGQLDTALRGRSFIQDINFTIEETLSIIKGLMPSIEPDKYSMESKQKAFDFLELLSLDKNYQMDISVRIFCLCTKLFESAAGDNAFTDDDVRSMIKEQIRNQSLRGGKKY